MLTYKEHSSKQFNDIELSMYCEYMLEYQEFLRTQILVTLFEIKVLWVLSVERISIYRKNYEKMVCTIYNLYFIV